jgi:L-glyceraldehyde 3-phosphate reductase
MDLISPQYKTMNYRQCGTSGLKLPPISLGLWHNFGSVDIYENAREMILHAFNCGITHFDLANNYGPEPGSAEETFGRVLRKDLSRYRDELIISTKAGYYMWPGPYGDGGSRKYLLASLDQSLKRTQLEYVDIFYHHRPDPETPIEESVLALDHAVRQGKALYAGISSYNSEQTKTAITLMRELRTPCIIHQVKYNMFYREIENNLLVTLKDLGLGCIVFSPLAQGLLTEKYLKDIPPDSRAAKPTGFLRADEITNQRREQINKLNTIASSRGQSLAQLALAWVLRHETVTSALIGTSSVEQIDDNLSVLKNLALSTEELQKIDEIILTK